MNKNTLFISHSSLTGINIPYGKSNITDRYMYHRIDSER